MQTDDPELQKMLDAQASANQALRRATEWMLDPANNNTDRKFAGAVPYLHLTGTVVGGWLMTRAAIAARNGADFPEAFLDSKCITTKFYADGGDSVLALAEDAF